MVSKPHILFIFLAIALCFHLSYAQRLIPTLQEEGWCYNEAVLADIIAKVYGDSMLAKLIDSGSAKGRVFLFFNSSGKIENIEINLKSGDGLVVLPKNSFAKFKIKYLFEQQIRIYDHTIEPDCYYCIDFQYPRIITITPFNNIMSNYYQSSKISPLQYLKTEIKKYKILKIESLKEHIIKMLNSKDIKISDAMKKRMEEKLKVL